MDLPMTAPASAMEISARNGNRTRPEGGRVLERMLDMMSAIPRAPGWISTAQVHERLQALGYAVDRRTVVRDLNKLAARFGVERRGEAAEDGTRTALAYAWRWPAGSAGIGAPVLNEAEALTLVMVREHLDHLLPPMVTEALAPQFARAEARLRNAPAIGGGLKHWHESVRVAPPTQSLGRPAVKHAVREGICLALAARRQFTGWYRRAGEGEAQEWLFNPLGLVIRGQVTYLVAALWNYDDVRLYPLQRFDRVRAGEAPRREPPGFDLDRYLAGQNGLGFATGRGDIALRLRFHDGAGQHLLETPLADDQLAVDDGDGALTVTATVPDTSQLGWWLLGFGGNVEVLAPRDLRARMTTMVRRMGERYR